MNYIEKKCLVCNQIYAVFPEHQDESDGVCPTCKINQMKEKKMQKKVKNFWQGIKSDI